MKGMSMMMQSLGIDPEKIMKDFTELKEGVQVILKNLDKKIDEIKSSQLRVEARQTQVLEMTERLNHNLEALWQMNRTALRMSSQIQLVPTPQLQPHIAQPQPNPQPAEQSQTQTQPQPQPQNPPAQRSM